MWDGQLCCYPRYYNSIHFGGGGETACLIGNAYYEFLNKLHDPSEYIRDPTHTHPQRQAQTVEIRQTGQCFPFPK